MVAKGHDFPDVVLGVVLDADATLRFPDFRAEERTFALVAQLAGRSGRGERGGRVLVQTLAPEAAAIAHAARHDAAGFLAGELERRRELGYPPFSHLIRVELAEPRRRARSSGAAAACARRSTRRCRRAPWRSARRRAFASAAASAASSWSRRPSARRRSPPSARRCDADGAGPAAARDRGRGRRRRRNERP